MAEPIRKIKRMEISEEAIQEQNLSEVVAAVSNNKEAILKGIDLLASINESGGLEIMDALIKHREVAFEKLITEMNKERYAGSLENIMKLFVFIGNIKVDELEPLVHKVNEGISDLQSFDSDESTSYMGMLRALKDPEINRSITMLLQFLRTMGKE